MTSTFDSIVNAAPRNFFDLNEQNRACQRILSSVVHLAIKDSCIRPVTDRRGRSIQAMHPNAFTAMRFLFDTNYSGLAEYATWLDFDAGQFRTKLLALMRNDSAGVVHAIPSEDRRAFRVNYKNWSAIKDNPVAQGPLDEDTDD